MTLLKTATSIYIGPNGEQTDMPSSHRDFVNSLSDYLKTDHCMRSNKQDGGRIKNETNGLLLPYAKKAELAYALKKSAAARSDSERRYWCKQAADYMGNTNDGELEQAVFTLSSHFIKEKAPKLFDMGYFVGFRVLDKSDDNTKVVGIYGFKIGKTWAYVPIFFDKGKLNGYELCYLENRDQFVPLKEGWVDWIIKSAGDEALGKADTKDLRQLGVRYPDMRQLTQPPTLGKAASAAVSHLEPWVQRGVLGFAKHAAALLEDDEFDLMKIGSADPKVFARLAVACDTYPILKVAMENFYGREAMSRMYLNTLQNHRRKTAARQKLAQSSTWAPRATTRPAVRVVTENDSQFFPYLTEKQAEDLIGGPITIDEREEDEVATIEDEIKFVSPHQTGVYDVFCADGSFRECLVIVNPMFIKSRPDRELCLVIDWKRRKHIYAKAMAVLCVKGSYKDEWFNRLPADAFKPGSRMRDAESEDPSSDKHVDRPRRVFVTPEGQGTVPLPVESLGSGLWAIDTYVGGSEEHRDRTYDVNENVNFSIGLLQMLRQQYTTPEEELGRIAGPRPRWCVCSPMLAGTKITVRDDKLILPSKFKYIDLDEGYGAALPLGTENDVISILYANRRKLTATKTASGYLLNGQAYDRDNAFKTLVLDYSFRGKTASDILEAADEAYRHGYPTLKIPYLTPRHKTAELPIDPVFLRDGMLSQMPDGMMSPIFDSPQVHSDGYSGLPIQEGIDSAQQLGYESQPTPPEWGQEVPPPDPMAMQQATEAAQTGQKNVFDVSMLAGLLKTNRSDELIGEYSKTFKLALSHVGRVMFKLFWDRESFIDRFGEEDMEKFEDLLRDVFSNLGDLVLYLLTKDDRPELVDFLDSIGSDE